VALKAQDTRRPLMLGFGRLTSATSPSIFGVSNFDLAMCVAATLSTVTGLIFQGGKTTSHMIA
jgi:hypothetical protein